jgi:beta-aspartyl-peptidase (threonine type)
MEGEQADAVTRAGEEGMKVLRRGGSALDSVEVAVRVMEDAEIFDAGSGSVLCSDGKVRMHAAVMDGSTHAAGAVILITQVKNPVSVARMVMEKTDNVILGGEGATSFAHAVGFPRYTRVPRKRRRQYEEFKKGFATGKATGYFLNWKHYARARALSRSHPEVFWGDTVGAVAVDGAGSVAGACSTGGMLFQMPGRVGDTGVIGSGLYAENNSGAVTVTGLGEVSIRYGIAKQVCTYMQNGDRPQRAVDRARRYITRREDVPLGIIAINSKGETGLVYNTRGMAYAHFNALGRVFPPPGR